MNSSYKLGGQGEALAAAFLWQKKYQIIERNYRHGRAEVKLIAIKDNFLVVVEIKTISTAFFGASETFLNTNNNALGKQLIIISKRIN